MSDGGTPFGRYRLLRMLTSDAVSTTYFATSDDGRSGASQWAVRVARPVDPDDEHAVDMARLFLAEEQRAAMIDHPTIVRPHDLGFVDDRPFVATPFVRAVPLGELLLHGGTINQTAALAMFAQLAGALDAAHRARVVHGALSPQTVWVGPSAGKGVAYVAYLTGFGTATLLRDHMAAAPRGAPVDDVLYVAPEQLRGQPTTAESDQYALACAVFHTLAGRPPYERDTRSKLYGAHMLAPVPDLSVIDPGVADATTAALRRAMSKDPADRFASCGAFIHTALPGGPQVHGAANAGSSGWARDLVLASSRHRWSAALIIAAVVLVGALAWMLLGAGDDRAAAGDAAATAASEPAATAPSPAASEVLASAAASAAPVIAWEAALGDQRLRSVERAGDAVVIAAAGSLTAYDAASGEQRWQVGADGIDQVVGGSDLVVYASGEGLTAVDVDTGDVAWTASADRGAFSSATLTSDAVVAVAGTAGAPEVLALDVTDGTEVWHLHTHSSGPDAAMYATATDRRTYVVQGTSLGAVDGSATETTASGRGQVDGYDWQIDVDAPWPGHAATEVFVVIATEEGQVCRYEAQDGAMTWCQAVPGIADEQPRLFAHSGTVVASTPAVVVGLDAVSGETIWSLSPGASADLVAVGNGRVALGAEQGVRVLDVRTGSVDHQVSHLENLTAVTVAADMLVVANADGELAAIELSDE